MCLTDENMNNNANDNLNRFCCPCCGYYTLESVGEYEICPVCFWEDDPLQRDKPDLEGGANKFSLNESRENYKKYGACEERLVSHVRKPLPEEALTEMEVSEINVSETDAGN